MLLVCGDRRHARHRSRTHISLDAGWVAECHGSKARANRTADGLVAGGDSTAVVTNEREGEATALWNSSKKTFKPVRCGFSLSLFCSYQAVHTHKKRTHLASHRDSRLAHTCTINTATLHGPYPGNITTSTGGLSTAGSTWTWPAHMRAGSCSPPRYRFARPPRRPWPQKKMCCSDLFSWRGSCSDIWYRYGMGNATKTHAKDGAIWKR